MSADHTEEHDAGYDWRARFPERTVVRSTEGGLLAVADDEDGPWLIVDEGTMADLLPEEDRRGLVKILRFATGHARDAELAVRTHQRGDTGLPTEDGSQLTERASIRMGLDLALCAAVRGVMEEHGPARPGTERAWGRLVVEALRELPPILAADDDVAHGELAWPWTRPPGPVGLVGTVEGGRGAAELKICKPEELMWDLVKLADHAGAAGAAFAFAAICVQAEPSDLTQGPGLLLTGALSGVQRPRDWIEQWPNDWQWLMCGGRGIRPTSLPRRVVLGEPTVIGDGSGTHVRVVPIAGTGLEEPRDELDPWGWPAGIGPRPDGWRNKVTAAEAPRGSSAPQEMVNCAGYPIPARFRPRQPGPWLAEHYPQMDAAQRQELLRLLRLRGWTEQEFAELLPGLPGGA
ncbi:MAG: hypothetical protein ACEQSX_04245 [Baekduiaceae bacterium]